MGERHGKGVRDPAQPQWSDQIWGGPGAEMAEVVDQMGFDGHSYDFIFLLPVQKVTGWQQK